MIVLALDTTSRGGSCALVRDDGRLRVVPGDAARPHDARLPGELMGLLEDERLTLDGIDVFAVATGPGSFTGLRVGIATMQGLAFACRRPLIGVSALDALASVAMGDDPLARQAVAVAVWMDAWRGEVASALYRDGHAVVDAVLEPVAAALDRLPAGPVAFIGDGAALHADAIRTARPDARIVEPAAPPLAGIIGRLAQAAGREGHLPPPDAIRPLYVRRADGGPAGPAHT